MSRFLSTVSEARGKAKLIWRLSAGLMLLGGASTLSLLTGCGMGASAPGDPTRGMAIQGNVHGGQQPVVGAKVYLFAASTAGYASAPVSLLKPTDSGVLTDGNGNGYVLTTGPGGSFSITNDWTCPTAPGDQVYLLAVGGNPGLGSGDNPQLALMAAMGSCSSNLTASTFVSVNELTTVASAYALAQFMNYTGSTVTSPTPGAIPQIGAPTGGPSCNAGANWLSTGASTCNYLGLKNAFATAGNLVNMSTGQAYTVTPAYAGNVTAANTSYVPAARLNTLANILSACVNSAGGSYGDGTGPNSVTGDSNCGTLFDATTPNLTGVPPTDTLQAVLNLALNPGPGTQNNTDLFSLVSANAPFQSPAPLTAQPNDWTLALGFTGGGFTNANLGTVGTSSYGVGLAIDGGGSIWATGPGDFSSNTGFLAKFNNQGAPLSPATTATAVGGYSAGQNIPLFAPGVDLSGDVWSINFGSGTLSKMDQSGAQVFSPISLPSSVTSYQPGTIAIDASGDAWVSGSAASEGGTILEYNGSGSLQPTSYTTTNTTSYFSGLALDSGGTIWADGGFLLQVNTSTGALVTSNNNDGAAPGYIVTDSAGNAYSCGSGYLVTYTPTSTAGTRSSANNVGCNIGGGSFGYLSVLALDGAGNAWMPVISGSLGSLIEANAASQSLVSPATGYLGIGSGTATSDGEPSISLIGSDNISGIGVDGSGNVWMLNESIAGTGFYQLVEFVGVGAPTVTPTALAVKYGTETQLP